MLLSKPLVVVLTSLLLACTRPVPEKGVDTGEVVPTDVDGDGFAAEEGDCDDADAARFPGAEETCNERDDDCDGQVDEDLGGQLWVDADGDGWGDAARPLDDCSDTTSSAARPGDCDDAAANIHPDAAELCDGVDQDCDGVVDDSPEDGDVWYVDADGDGAGDDTTAHRACDAEAYEVAAGGDCDDTNPAAAPGFAEACDETDNDCDDEVDEGVTRTAFADLDGDGWGDAVLTQQACALPTGYAWDPGDCDDTRPDVSPSSVEVCGDVDEDCDGIVDEDDAVGTRVWFRDADGDAHGAPDAARDACVAPSGHVATGDDCDDASGEVFPGAVESCNGRDDDCDGLLDESGAAGEFTWFADGDADGFGDAATSVLACEAPTGTVRNDADCDDTRADVSPVAIEVCGGADEDCDGTTDEDDAADARRWFWDGDADGHGDAASDTRACEAPLAYVALSDDCDDRADDVFPGAPETCDGRDEDCDGTADEPGAIGESTWYADGDADGFGDPDAATQACDAPAGDVAVGSDCDDTDATVFPGAGETPDGVDEDCDGTTDEGTTAYDDDGDGYTEEAGDCDDARVDTHVGATEVWYDGRDQACDGGDDNDADGDGFAATGHGGTDCDDTRGDVSPTVSERCDDGIDNDCDGAADAADSTCPDATIVVRASASDVSIAALAGYPSVATYLQVRVEPGVTLYASSPGSVALTTAGLPTGSRVDLVNLGTIHGAGGDGACGGGGAGEDGGDAIRMTVDMVIDTSAGGIYGGGGGGGAGDDPSGGGGGAGGGRGCDGGGDASGGVGGHGGQRFGALPGGDGALYDGSVGVGGRWGDPGTNGGGGSGGRAYGSALGGCCAGPGGSGGGWGGGGGGGLSADPGNPRNAGDGGDAGYAVRVMAGSLTWSGGYDTTHVKGEAR